MSLSINTNLASAEAQRSQGRTQGELATAIARLSSGVRINSARDDAAGLAISDRFTAQIRGTTQAGRNANDGISLTQTAEGALGSIGDNLQRMRELAVQSANATNSASDRASLQLEVAQLQAEIDRVATQTSFNGINLLDGSFTSKAFQVGANVGQTITLDAVASARTRALGQHVGFEAPLTNFNTPGFGSAPAAYAFSVSLGGAPPIGLGAVDVDGKMIADAVNHAGIDGLSATVEVNRLAGVSAVVSATSAGTATYTVNGVAINIAGVTGAGAAATNRASAVAAINAQSQATGVVAGDDGSRVTLTAADGRSMYLSYSAGSFAGSGTDDFGLSTATFAGAHASIFYSAPSGVTGNVVFTIAGNDTTFAIGAVGTPLDAIDVSTVAGANAALASVDAGLRSIDGARASLGAAQNRFASTLQNLQASGANLAASRSRIQDADFAMETASLSRAQVLQQAATAMIAQANQLPRQVLALLR